MTKIEFNTLVMRQAGSLRMYALHFTHDSEDANDLVQDTLLKAITYYNKFKDGTNLKGWLYTIMKNTFINNYRRFVKISAFITKSEDISSPNLLFSSAKNSGESKFIMDDIGRALNKLPEEYYVPFIRYYEGHKYHEIAEYLNIPIGTVKTRIHVARKLLKKSLKPYDNPSNKKPVYYDN
ncbi:MAG: RNA polymerase sigma factor [Sphingobacteriaceae bacterium]